MSHPIYTKRIDRKLLAIELYYKIVHICTDPQMSPFLWKCLYKLKVKCWEHQLHAGMCE